MPQIAREMKLLQHGRRFVSSFCSCFFLLENFQSPNIVKFLNVANLVLYNFSGLMLNVFFNLEDGKGILIVFSTLSVFFLSPSPFDRAALARAGIRDALLFRR